MAVGRLRSEWDQTSLVWSIIANTARDPKKQSKPFSPALVHPFRSEKDYEEQPIQADISALKMLLPNGKLKRD